MNIDNLQRIINDNLPLDGKNAKTILERVPDNYYFIYVGHLELKDHETSEVNRGVPKFGKCQDIPALTRARTQAGSEWIFDSIILLKDKQTVHECEIFIRKQLTKMGKISQKLYHRELFASNVSRVDAIQLVKNLVETFLLNTK